MQEMELLTQLMNTLTTFQAETMKAFNEIREELKENRKRWEENEKRWQENMKRWEENERRWQENKKMWELNEIRRKKDKEDIEAILWSYQTSTEDMYNENKEKIIKLEKYILMYK